MRRGARSCSSELSWWGRFSHRVHPTHGAALWDWAGAGAEIPCCCLSPLPQWGELPRGWGGAVGWRPEEPCTGCGRLPSWPRHSVIYALGIPGRGPLPREQTRQLLFKSQLTSGRFPCAGGPLTPTATTLPVVQNYPAPSNSSCEGRRTDKLLVWLC